MEALTRTQLMHSMCWGPKEITVLDKNNGRLQDLIYYRTGRITETTFTV